MNIRSFLDFDWEFILIYSIVLYYIEIGVKI